MKKLIAIFVTVFTIITLAACTKAERVSHNLSQEADSFNISRKLTVINAIQGEVLFEITGNMSIEDDGNQLEIVTKEKNEVYKKHFVHLSDNVTYVVEDITGSDVNTDHYTIKFNPKSVLPNVQISD